MTGPTGDTPEDAQGAEEIDTTGLINVCHVSVRTGYGIRIDTDGGHQDPLALVELVGHPHLFGRELPLYAGGTYYMDLDMLRTFAMAVDAALLALGDEVPSETPG